MGYTSKEVIEYWEDIVTNVGEDLNISNDVINIFKTNKDIQTYVHLAIRQYVPSLEDLIVIAALSCSEYLKIGELGKVNLIWFCYKIRDEFVRKLILLDEENYSYVQNIKEENYNDITNISCILKLLSSEKDIYKAYKTNKLKYLKNVLPNPKKHC